MVRLNQLHLFDIVKRQFAFKLKAHHNLIGTFILFQILGLFFSFYGQKSSVTEQAVTFTIETYSSDIIIGFTLVWIFVLPFYLTSASSKKMMHSFVTNKVTNFLSDIGLMFTLSLIGAISSVLLGTSIRLGILWYYDFNQIFTYEMLSVSDLLLTIFLVFLYHLLLFSFSYLLGTTMQLHPRLVIIVPLLLLIIPFFSIVFFNKVFIFSFYVGEKSLIVFICKVLASSITFWLLSFFIDRRLEVGFL